MIKFESTSHVKSKVEVFDLLDNDKIPYKRFNYNLEEQGSVSLVFQNEERLIDPEIIKNKSVVIVGETPYARDAMVVEKNIEQLRKSADFLTFQHTKPRYGQKYHFKAGVGWEDFGTRTSLSVNPPKPETDLNFHALDKLREAAKKGDTEFFVNRDVNSVVNASFLLEKTFPTLSGEGERLNKDDTGYLEDLMVASSFDEKGQIADHSEQSRNLLIRGLLGDKSSKEELENSLAENKSKFPPFIVSQALLELENLKRQLEIVEKNKEHSSSIEQAKTIRQQIKNVEGFIEKSNHGERVEIPDDVVRELDKHVAIHMTSYYPVFDEKTKEWAIPTHSGATGNRVGRLTVHFAVDAIATAAMIGQGKWNEMPYAVVVPLGQLMKKNGPMGAFLPSDTWWVVDPNEMGVKLPESAIIIAQNTVKGELKRVPDAVEESTSFNEKADEQFTEDGKNNSALLHRGPNEGIKKWTSNIDQPTTLKKILRMYGVNMRTVGNEGWGDDYQGHEEWELRATIKGVYPAVSKALHSNTSPAEFEQKIMWYLNEGLLADNKEKIRDVDVSQSIGWEKTKNRVLAHQPEVLVENARKYLIEYVNKSCKARYDVNTEPEKIPTLISREFARQLVKLGII